MLSKEKLSKIQAQINDWAQETSDQLEVEISKEGLDEACQEIYENELRRRHISRNCAFHHILAYVINNKFVPMDISRQKLIESFYEFETLMKRAEELECRENERNLLSPTITKLYFEYEEWRKQHEKSLDNKKK